MSNESSKAIVQRFRDALNAGDLDGAFAVLAPNAVVHMQSIRSRAKPIHVIVVELKK